MRGYREEDDELDWETLAHEGVVAQTQAAVLFRIDGEEVWIPKSQIERFDDGEVSVAGWIARQKGLA